MDDMARTSPPLTLTSSSSMVSSGKDGIGVIKTDLVLDLNVGRGINERLFAFQVSSGMW